MTSETTAGRMPIQVVRIDQPFCEHTFGVAPCTATGAAGTECFNTRSSCQDAANFSLGDGLPLYFGLDNISGLSVEYLTTEDGDVITTEAGDPITLAEGTNPAYVIPCLRSVSTSPTKINLAGANRNIQGLGVRAVANIQFSDFTHTDRVVDPYVDTRAYDPLERSTFWLKWIARNKYRQNILITVYEGYVGQSLSEMVSRKYFMQDITYPDASGRVRMTGKDILAKLEERKSEYPRASAGVLYAGITSAATSFEVSNSVLADYAVPGTIRIDDEIMTYTSTATTSNGVTFSGVTRGTDFSTADDHGSGTTVQACVRYSDDTINDVLTDVLTVGAGIPTAYIDASGWLEELSAYLGAYLLRTVISEPVPCYTLVSQLQIECQFYAWWDERDALIKVRAIRGIDSELPTMTDEANIIADSVSMVELPAQRASQVWVYHTIRDYTLSATEDNSFKKYKVGEIIANLESEGENLYGEPSIRKIYSRFLQSGSLAQTTATRISNRYVDVPREIRFSMDAKDRNKWVGDTVIIDHPTSVDIFGSRLLNNWTITSAEEIEFGETVRYTAEDTTIYGKVRFVMAAGAADYPGYDSAPFKNCYIGDADGLLSDGEQCGRVS